MDLIHSELDALLRSAREVQFDSEWLEVLEAIDAHLRSHFETEDAWMRETEFPPRECHIDEHSAVLRSSAEVLDLARGGDVGQAPGFTAELESWFPGHASFLDSALAAWMCKLAFGGKPVVLHRRPNRSGDAGG